MCRIVWGGMGVWGAALAALSLSIALAPVRAQSPRTLREVEAFALRNNLDILVARTMVDSAQAERRLAGALPNPVVSGIPGNPNQLSAELPLDLGLQRIYRTRASAQGVSATTHTLNDAIRQVLLAVRTAYYDALLADAIVGVRREQRDIVRQLLEADSVRFRDGDAPERNVGKSELELARAEANLTRSQADRLSAALNLQGLMGIRHPSREFSLDDSLRFTAVVLPTDSLLAWALQNRPDLLAASDRLTQSHSLKSLAASALFPTPVATLVYQPNDAFDRNLLATFGGRKLSLGLAIEVPLFNWYGGARARAEAGVQAAEATKAKAELQVETDVAVAADRLRAARSLAERYAEGLLGKAARALADARYAYGAGATSQVDLLDAVRTNGEIRSEYLQAVRDYWVALAGVRHVVGKDVIAP